MIETDRSKHLRLALILVGVTFVVGIYTLVMVWPSGWAWHTGQSHHLPHYLQMILGCMRRWVSSWCWPAAIRSPT